MIREFKKVVALIDPSLRKRWVVVGVLGLLVSIIDATGALLIVFLFRLVQEPKADIGLPFLGRLNDLLPGWTRHDQLIAAGAAIAVFFIVRGVAIVVQLHLQYDTAGRSGLSLSDRLFHRYLRLPLAEHLSDNSARFIRNINDSSMLVAVNAFLPVIAVTSESMLVVAMVGVLFVTNPQLTAIAGVLLGLVIILVLRLIQPRIQRLGVINQAAAQADLQALHEAFAGIRDVKVGGAERYFHRVFMGHRRTHVWAGFRPMMLSALPRIAIEMAFILFLIPLLVFTGTSGASSADAVASLGLFGYALLRLLPATNRIVTSLATFRYGIAAADEVRHDLIGPLPVDEADGVTETSRLRFERGLTVEHITFRYPGTERDALSDVSVEIPKATSIGIVGPTGSGKSTLVDIVLGLLVPQAGSVRVDGVDIQVDLRGWHRQVGLVPQVLYLADDTLRRNIAFGLDDDQIDDVAVIEAVKLAQLEDFVATLPEGLDSVVGERGGRLSGGQRQRVVIARALYRKPDVIVLDEGTSALDNETEMLLLRSLEALRRSHTVIMVAHRISTVRDCDQILVMRDGKVEGLGTYDELLNSSEVFQRLTH